MDLLQPPRGMRDIIGDTMRRFDAITSTARTVARLYHYHEIIPPTLEFTALFARTSGESSDIVAKEMYSFTDRGGESLSLRPEGTASVCRAIISNGLTQNLPQKLFYIMPMFRYDRPQKGRYRQHFQFGVEVLGVAEPCADAEIIIMAADFLQRLGLLSRCVLHLNTLGDAASRSAYRAALTQYYSGHVDKLSVDSQRRLQQNPLRILDSKDDGDKALLPNAPSFSEYLTQDAQDFFARVQELLASAGVTFQVDPHVVRGMDYYAHTTFEFVTADLGAQATVLGGGRYDGLMNEISAGKHTIAGVGFGSGIDRLEAMWQGSVPPTPTVLVLALDEPAQPIAAGLTQRLRANDIAVDDVYDRPFKKALKYADASGAAFVCIIGEAERLAGTVQVKNMRAGSQQTVPLADVVTYLQTAM